MVRRFLAPSYPPEMQQYTRGLAEVGANVLKGGDSPRRGLPPTLKPYLAVYLQVPRIMGEDDVINRLFGMGRGSCEQRACRRRPAGEAADLTKERVPAWPATPR